jgi:hypothetical protein
LTKENKMRVKEMLKTHPNRGRIDVDLLAKCIEACYGCAQTCASCADACLSESDPQSLIRCITLNLNCASICEVTGQLVTRQTAVEWALIYQQLQACATACRLCGDECERHAGHHEHCRVCAEACRHCEEACQRLLEAIPVPA